MSVRLSRLPQPFQIDENLLQKFLGNALLLGNRLDSYGAFTVVQAQHQEAAQPYSRDQWFHPLYTTHLYWFSQHCEIITD